MDAHHTKIPSPQVPSRYVPGVGAEEPVYQVVSCVRITAVVASPSTRWAVRCVIRCATRFPYSDNLLGRLTRGAYSAKLLGNEALGRLVVGMQIYISGLFSLQVEKTDQAIQSILCCASITTTTILVISLSCPSVV
jgi:hypothetical protein